MVDPVQWQALPIAWRQNSVKPQLKLLKQTQSQRLLLSQVAEAVAEKQRQEKGPEEDKVSKTLFSTKRITTHYLISTQLLIICFYSPLTCTPCKWAFFLSLLILACPLNGQKGK